MDIQEQISQLANAFDPDRDADAQASRALLQGTLVGLVARAAPGALGACKVKDFEQDMDADGNYLPYFTIITGTGHRIRVSVEVE